MSPPSLLAAAIDELYGIDAADFMARRKALAVAARAAGDKDAARDITALRKPTKSAYAVNRLIRADPAAGVELSGLADELRRGERSVDANLLRRLADRRREVVNGLTDRAFITIDEPNPTAGLREEVADTFRAGLVDADVAAQIRQGCLLRSVEWDGFGFSSRPGLSVVRPEDPGPSVSGSPVEELVEPAAGPAGAAESAGSAGAAAEDQARRREADRREAEELRRRLAQLQAIAAAEEVLEAAETNLADAARVVADNRHEVAELKEQLRDAQESLTLAEREAGTAEAAHRAAVRALERARISEV
ncbi:hypothetical protein D1871_15250 [Nakamurella silvestris]|nr:hypothetical protein D1871_15250 [Nakamurella silvestris]